MASGEMHVVEKHQPVYICADGGRCGNRTRTGIARGILSAFRLPISASGHVKPVIAEPNGRARGLGVLSHRCMAHHMPAWATQATIWMMQQA